MSETEVLVRLVELYAVLIASVFVSACIIVLIPVLVCCTWRLCRVLWPLFCKHSYRSPMLYRPVR